MNRIVRVAADHLEWREVESEVVILDLRSSRYLSMNSSAAALWKQLLLGAASEKLVEALRSTYGLSEERASADVHAFLDEVIRLGLAEEAFE